MENSQEDEALVYYSDKGPDVLELKKAYDSTITDVAEYISQCQKSYQWRRNEWPGKSDDLRKNGVNAFPWKGASDTEAHVISDRIATYVSLCMMALARANIRAYPVEANDVARAKVVSSFLKYMISSYIPNFTSEMELGANYFFEKAILVTYIGWEQEKSRYLQTVSLEQITQSSPDLARTILAGDQDDLLVQMLQSFYPDLSVKRAKKALNELRKKGEATIPTTRRIVNRPCVKTCAPDGELVFPPYCMDPQKAPYVFYRVLMTAQQIEGKVATEGWDKDWAEYVIEKCKGTYVPATDYYVEGRRNIVGAQKTEDLYEIIYAFQRLIDEEDGAQGIYRTIFHPNYTGKDGEQGYAKFELLNGYEDYPFVVTKLSRDTARLYDVQTMPEQLRGIQDQVKVERDSRVDRNGLATMPPLLHPQGKPPSGEWKPGGLIGRMRREDFEFGPTPPFNPGSVEMEQTMLRTADSLTGLDAENPLSQAKRQFFVDKFLSHVRDVIKASYKAYQRFGPDSLFFRVTGSADPMKFEKGSPDEDFDIRIAFDVQTLDPEADKGKVAEQIAALLPYDRNGRINIDGFVEFAVNAVAPEMADAFLQPIEAAQQKVAKDVTDDLTKIYSGIEVGARPNGAQMALQMVQQYAQQPDIAQKLQQDQIFAQRLQKYAEQYQMALMQAQNAEIGRLGTAPAQMGSVNTQAMASS